jgi:uncharacterized protein
MNKDRHITEAMISAALQEPISFTPLTPDEYDEADAILDELRTRYDETPEWEFCEGFMAALICSRRPVLMDEYIPVLLGIGDEPGEDEGSFADEIQKNRFFELWFRRWNEVATALDAKVDNLQDEAAYQPEVMDVRGAVAALTDEERAEMGDEAVPSFAQVWALGFMYVVEAWPEEWADPRDKQAVKWLHKALDAIVALTEDDLAPPTLSVFDEDGPHSLSVKRLNAFADGVWAVYDLHEMWRNLGPRIETVRKLALPGRNDPCSCGSGKKFKKCCGA